jgi:hypothetical protein
MTEKSKTGNIDLIVNDFVSFVEHGHTRHSQIPLILKFHLLLGVTN